MVARNSSVSSQVRTDTDFYNLHCMVHRTVISWTKNDLLDTCLKKSCIPDCWKVSYKVIVFKNVNERFGTKNYHPRSLQSIVSKIFEKLLYKK